MSLTASTTMRAIAAVLCALGTATAIAISGAPGARADSSVAQVDAAVLAAIRADGSADFWVHFDDPPDLSGAASITDWDARGRYVVDRLKAAAKRSQAETLSLLRGQRYTAFWASNTIFVRHGTRAALDAVRSRPEVGAVTAEHVYTVSPDEAHAADPAGEDVEWGIADIHADDVWGRYGDRGAGVVVGSIDSGVDVTHPALAARYRGAQPDGTRHNDYNWFDPSHDCPTDDPCDDGTHGTHTMGSVLGDGGAGNHIGVAPEATWIAAKGCRVYTCSAVDLVAAGQWMLAPADVRGTHPDPARRPQIIYNPWQDSNSADPWYRDIVRAWTAAGMFPVFSAGSAVPNICSSLAAPASYPESYAVTGHDREDRPAFWALGPSPFDGSTKPDISAPGVDIRSAGLEGTYLYYTGTSMATAYVAGAAALVISGAPHLAGDVAAVRAALDRSAVDVPPFSGCGGTDADNNSSGQGRLDVLRAVRSVTADVGLIAGRVTDAASDEPVGAAGVTVDGKRVATTNPDGTFHASVEPGTRHVIVNRYGFRHAAVDVAVAAGDLRSIPVHLTAKPRVQLTGTVTDGGGHHWPLYARLDVPGDPDSPFFTDPSSGRYALDLVAGQARELTVTAQFPGYRPTTRTVPGAVQTQDFALALDATCTAMGYTFAGPGVFSSFDSGLPDGWTMVNHQEPFADGWTFDDRGHRGNRTGGTGGFAAVDSAYQGYSYTQNGELITPAVDVSSMGEPYLRFNQDVAATPGDILDVDVSTDGIAWTNVWRHNGFDGDLRGPRVEEIDLAAYVGEPHLQIRFHYQAADSWWWEVDNVLVGDRSVGTRCATDPGGLVVGTVTDATTHAALPGATVSSPTRAVDVSGTPADDAVSEAFYALFSAQTGPVPFTAARLPYPALTRTVRVVPDTTTRADFNLRSGHLVVDQHSIRRSISVDGFATATVTITNDGTAPAHVRLVNRNRSAVPGVVDPLEQSRPMASSNRFDPRWRGNPAALAGDPSPAGTTSAPPWESRAPLPSRVYDNAAAALDGKIYSAGGYNASGELSDLNIYDPVNDNWTRGPSMSVVRQAGQLVALGGELYAYGGWNATGVAQRSMEIYDPGTGRWRAGPAAPFGRARHGMAVLHNRIYVISGCTDAECDDDQSVLRYDPTTRSWAQLGRYPEPVVGLACGTIDNAIYCSGGVPTSGPQADFPSASTYRYDAAHDTWTRVADAPFATWGAQTWVADGALVLAGGIHVISWNYAFAYDPVANRWDELPSLPYADGVGGGACGGYVLGGWVAYAHIERAVLRLPGFEHCGRGDAPWLSVDHDRYLLAPGESHTFAVDVDPAAGNLDQPGTYNARLLVEQDTVRTVQPIDVRLLATPPAAWGRVAGAISDRGHCGLGGGGAVRGARVTLGGHSVRTDADGHFALWAPRGPAQLTVESPRWATANAHVAVRAGTSITTNLGLHRRQACVRPSDSAVAITVTQGATAKSRLTIANRGKAGVDLALDTTPYALAALGPTAAPPGGPGRLPSATAPTGPPTAAWYRGADLPGGLSGFGAVQCDGDPNHAYAIGGVDGGRQASDATWRYDAMTNTWTELAPLPEPLYWLGLTCETGRIHAMGGERNRDLGELGLPPARTSHYVYDIATDTWTIAPALPRPVSAAAAGQWNGKIFLAGGSAGVQTGPISDEVDVYDTATRTWSVSSIPMPVPTQAAGYVQAGPYVYVAGGQTDAAGSVATVYRLDLRTGTWSTGPQLIEDRWEHGLAASGSAIYAFGGDQVANHRSIGLSSSERLDVTSWPDGAWASFTSVPRVVGGNRGYCSQAITGSEIWSIGGFDELGQFVTIRTWLHGVGSDQCPTIRADMPWLTTNLSAASIDPGASATVEFTVDTRSLAAGTYRATLLVSTTDPGSSELRIPIEVTVS